MFIDLWKRFTKTCRANQELANDVKRLTAEIAELEKNLSEARARERQRELEQTLKEQQALQQQVESEAMSLGEIAKTHTTTPEERDNQIIEIEIKGLNDKLDQINQAAQSALSSAAYLESNLQSQIYNEQNTRTTPLKEKLKALKLELVRSKLAKYYRPIDMRFLRRRKWLPELQLPVPYFASYAFNQTECKLQVSSTKGQPSSTGSTRLPEGLNRFYESTIAAFANHTKARTSNGAGVLIGIAAALPGTLPSWLRKNLPQMEKHFSALLVITEAPAWQVTVKEFTGKEIFGPQIPLSPYKSQEQDALLIGEKHGTFWLVTPFRTVSNSEFIWQHFKHPP